MANLPHQYVVNEMYEAACRDRDTPRNYLGMSSIGDACDHKLWYAFRGYTPRPFEGRTLMIFDLGNRVEDAVVHWLTVAGYRIEGQQEAFSAHNDLFRGHCDGIIHGVTSRPHILEIKSANDTKFKAFRDCGVQDVSPTYYCQVQCYMGYAGLERALFVIMNKNNCELYTERVYFSREAFEALHLRAHAILTSEFPPERPFDPENQNCKWCDFFAHCHEPALALQTRKTCGTCLSFRPNGLDFCCIHIEHPVPIKTWGNVCDEWQKGPDQLPF